MGLFSKDFGLNFQADGESGLSFRQLPENERVRVPDIQPGELDESS
jgi:hypothetical protein